MVGEWERRWERGQAWLVGWQRRRSRTVEDELLVLFSHGLLCGTLELPAKRGGLRGDANGGPLLRLRGAGLVAPLEVGRVRLERVGLDEERLDGGPRQLRRLEASVVDQLLELGHRHLPLMREDTREYGGR
jgi:DNA-binding transcriptional ArsR family regulator